MNINEKAAQILADTQVITIASIDKDGFPRPVPVVKLKNDGDILYFSTGTSSAKTAHFKANPKAGVSILHGDDSIVYTGIIEIIDDLEIKRSLWGDWMLPHFPLGVEDPEYCLMRFTPKSTTYWIDNVFVKDGKFMNMFCQSCGMLMTDETMFGTEKDGSQCQDYCCYCYKDGKFTQDCTMDEMIAHCAQFTKEFNQSAGTQFSEEEAVAQMKLFFPTLKRWKNL